MLKFDYNKSMNKLICIFEERMDSLSSPIAEKEISEKLEELLAVADNTVENVNLVFDLDKVDFVSSAFMRVCIKFVKKVKTENFKIINTKLMIKKTYKIAGLDKLINIE